MRWIRKRGVICTLTVGMLCFCVVMAYRNATGVMIAVSEATVRSVTTVAVNDAVYYTLGNSTQYDDLVTIDRSKMGEIISITANASKINRIARDTAYLSQMNLDKLATAGIDVPLGAFTGIGLLAGFGPKIHIPIIPISNVVGSFSSDFKAVGLNQVLHSIYLNVTADIRLVLPSRTISVASTTQVLICESVISGRIPDLYWDEDIFGDG